MHILPIDGFGGFIPANRGSEFSRANLVANLVPNLVDLIAA